MKRPDYSLTRRPARRAATRMLAPAIVALLGMALGGCGQAGESSGAPDSVGTADAAGDRSGGWRLANEASPYLREHADNPVEWFPWGPEAFERARALDRPVFLSIGYSSCHWCHVMERESFENSAIADLLNSEFVSIKVDREQRPDVDAQYMRALMVLTNGGGWPASLFLTPDGVPFAGGTYFPPEPAFGLPGFRGLLDHIHELWTGEREALLKAAGDMHSVLAADDLEALLAAPAEESGPDAPSDAPPGAAGDAAAFDARSTVAQGVTALVSRLDSTLGGDFGAPKFPPTLTLDFLLRQRQRSGVDVLPFVEAALRAMDRGGLHDQIAGGFHRYCVDERWEVPHFEKLLADNAQLAALYAQAFAITGQPRWAEVSRSTLAWMTRELRSPEGLYFGALDADSLPFDDEGRPLPGSRAEEGRYYLWTPVEIAAVLGSERGAAFAALFGVTAAGNFEDGRSIPRPMRPREQLQLEAPPGVPGGADLLPWLDAACEQLAQARIRRPRPARDEKCLAGWNGLAATGFARAGALLDDAELRSEAGRMAEALLLLVHEGRVAHQRFGGENSGDGTLFDHACVARGLLDAYAVEPDPRFLQSALAIAHALPRFQGEAGDFFETENEDPLLPARSRELFDSSQPAGSSVAIELLLRLAPLDDSNALEQAAERAIARLGPLATRNAAALPALLTALDHAVGPLAEVVVDGSGPGYEELLRATWRTPLPAALVVPAAASLSAALSRPGEADAAPSLLEGRSAPPGGARAWVCVHGTCQLPADTGAALAEQLARVVRR